MKTTRPWLISLASLVQGENRLRFDLDIAELGGSPREVAENPSFGELLGAIRVELLIVRTGRKLLVNGTVSFRARLACALCGRSYQRDFREPLTTQFAGEDEQADASSETEAEAMETELLQGHLLNLRDVVRDTIHLAIPIAPKCREECLGVCPICGADRNLGPCNCTP